MDIWINELLSEWGLTAPIALLIVAVLICVGVWRR